jgi:hypothetical protein
MDADACQTQTTRKKVAESTLEMGKKANKGVTAKGSWMGVDGGENADFSHFLLVPVSSPRFVEISSPPLILSNLRYSPTLLHSFADAISRSPTP